MKTGKCKNRIYTSAQVRLVLHWLGKINFTEQGLTMFDCTSDRDVTEPPTAGAESLITQATVFQGSSLTIDNEPPHPSSYAFSTSCFA